MKLNSLAFRLFATSFAWMLVVLPLAGWLIYSLYREDVKVGFDNTLIKLVDAITIDSMATTDTEPELPPNRYEPLFEVPNSGWYWQIKPIDIPQARSIVSPSLATGSVASPYALKFPADKTGKRWINTTGPDGKAIRIVEVVNSLGYQADRPRYSIIVAGPYDWIEQLIEQFRYRLTIALALVGAGLLAVTLVQVQFGLAPLRRIERGLAAVRSGEANELGGDLPVEIRPLQLELNELLRSNQDIVDRSRTQVGNLAHALKTPLAVITNEAADQKTEFAEKVVEQSQIMRDQVNHYLDRARMAARANVIGRVTPVAPVAEAIARALERINRDKGVVIARNCPEGLKFPGEKQDLEEMLGNLLDNACKWCSGSVVLTVASPPNTQGAGAGQRRLVVTVEDDGPGLTPEQREKIGKRGLRLDETKPGSGLGLSIVADIATTYRGRMSLEASPLGGLLVRLDLPAA
jgi:signal transduction histidine kinase